MKLKNREFLNWKTRVFFIGSTLALSGMFLEKSWVSLTALFVLTIGYGVGYYRYEYRHCREDQ
jgi:hypothetical protein